MGLLVQEKTRKIAFQAGVHDGNLGYPIGKTLAIFNLQVTVMLSIKFQVNWLLVKEGKRKRNFQDGGHGDHIGFSIGTILTLIYKSPKCFLPSFKSFVSGEETKNRFSRWRSS